MVMQIDSPGIAVARTLSGSNFACDGSTDSSPAKPQKRCRRENARSVVPKEPSKGRKTAATQSIRPEGDLLDTQYSGSISCPPRDHGTC